MATSEDRRQLRQVAEVSEETAEGLRFMARRFDRQAALRAASGRAAPAKRTGASRGGRPTRAKTSGDLAKEAPFVALMTEPAPELYKKIKLIDSAEMLREGHRFEARHLRRKTVFGWLEERLRQLGEPLGGPAKPPIANFDSLEQGQAILRIRQLAPEQAAIALAWEHYHQRRRRVIDAAESVCGAAGYELVEQTAPDRGEVAGLSEPFRGFDQLSTSPHARLELRRALSSQSETTLEQALVYEQAKKRRKTMLEAIEAALNLKRAA